MFLYSFAMFVTCVYVCVCACVCVCVCLWMIVYQHAHLRLELFKGFESFKVLVFGGDGSIGWVLSAIDRLQLHSKVCGLGTRLTND